MALFYFVGRGRGGFVVKYGGTVRPPSHCCDRSVTSNTRPLAPPPTTTVPDPAAGGGTLPARRVAPPVRAVSAALAAVGLLIRDCPASLDGGRNPPRVAPAPVPTTNPTSSSADRSVHGALLRAVGLPTDRATLAPPRPPRLLPPPPRPAVRSTSVTLRANPTSNCAGSVDCAPDACVNTNDGAVASSGWWGSVPSTASTGRGPAVAWAAGTDAADTDVPRTSKPNPMTDGASGGWSVSDPSKSNLGTDGAVSKLVSTNASSWVSRAGGEQGER